VGSLFFFAEVTCGGRLESVCDPVGSAFPSE
jgi:hypothetical protein